jgi:Peptidase family M23
MNPDLKVGESDPQHPAGNFIILQPSEHEDSQLVLAHLMNQSITVKAGDKVQYGDSIGRIGNSGNTSEPHLHIHAQKVDNGTVKGIPLRIEGRHFMRNSVIYYPDQRRLRFFARRPGKIHMTKTSITILRSKLNRTIVPFQGLEKKTFID